MTNKITLIKGYHAQERVASFLAKPISKELAKKGYDVNIEKVPKKTTHFYVINNPHKDIPFYSEFGQISEPVRLDHWFQRMLRRNRDSYIFDLHNAPYTHWSHTKHEDFPKSISDVRKLKFGKRNGGKLPLFYWDIEDHHGIKVYLIEMFADYSFNKNFNENVISDIIKRNEGNVESELAGWEVQTGTLYEYMVDSVDFKKSKKSGLISATLSKKIANGIHNIIKNPRIQIK